MKNDSISKYAFLVLPYGVLVLVRAVIGLQMEQPFIIADEIGYLGNARYLAGVSHMPDLRTTAFYHFGYSLFLLPAFWLFPDPVQAYKAVMVINALLSGLLFFPLYYVLDSILSTPRWLSIVASFTTCLYPSFVLQSNVAWAESAFITFCALLLALFIVLLNHKSYVAAVAFGCTASFLYTIHPRGLPIFVIAVAYLTLLALLRVLPMLRALAGIISACAIFVLTRVINAHLEIAGWGDQAIRNVPTVAAIASKVTHFKSFLLVVLAQILYLSQATYGLFLLGVASIFLLFWRRVSAVSQTRIHDGTLHWYTFLLLTSLGAFLASTLKIQSLKRGGQLIYGRYNEAFLAPYLAFAIIALYSAKPDRPRVSTHTFLVVAILGGLTLLVLAGRWHDFPQGPVVAANVFGIYPAVRDLGKLNLSTISLMAISVFLALRFAVMKSFVLGVLLVVALFSAVVVYDYRVVLLQAQRGLRASTTLASEIRSLSDIKTISYDWSAYHPVFFNYQYLLPNIVFHKFYSGQGGTPTSEAVISGNDWRLADTLDAEFVALENGVNNALWILPGALQAQLSKRLSSNASARLGAQRIRGVWETGFHGQEGVGAAPFRWTNGAAKLVVPLDERQRPEALRLELFAPGPKGARLQVVVNGHTLADRRIAGGVWADTFSLAGLTLGRRATIELLSDTIVPKEMNSTQDPRTLGVVVRSIRLLQTFQPVSAAPLPPEGYRSQLKRAEKGPRISVASASATSLTVTVRNTGNAVWPTFADLGQPEGSVRLGILWFAEGRTDRRLGEARADLPYTMFGNDETELPLPLTPRGYDGKPLPPGRYEVWLGMVQENVTWFYEKGDGVLKLIVHVEA